jgi:hypothetical protein
MIRKMKKTVFLVGMIALLLYGCNATKKTATETSSPAAVTVQEQKPAVPQVNFSLPETWILGYFKPGKLSSEPYSLWYLKGYDAYQPNNESLDKLLKISKDNLKIKIILGTWCPDSRREVPKFMRILDLWKFPMSEVQLIGVDNSKVAPIENYESLNIERVPTFIFFKNNIEEGRIIENPVTSLEQDMVNILNRNEKQ